MFEHRRRRGVSGAHATASESHAHEGVVRDGAAIDACDWRRDLLTMIDHVDEVAHVEVGNRLRSARSRDVRPGGGARALAVAANDDPRLLVCLADVPAVDLQIGRFFRVSE